MDSTPHPNPVVPALPGGGAYGVLADMVAAGSEGETCIVIVLGGCRGSGFSVATRDPAVHLRIPSVLRGVAGAIESGGSLNVSPLLPDGVEPPPPPPVVDEGPGRGRHIAHDPTGLMSE